MTGTAETEAAEFEKIYNLEIIIVPTNRSLIRHEYADVVYRTEREKFNAVIEEIKEYHLRGQPVLVGSIAIEKSERLSLALKKGGVVPARLQETAKADSSGRGIIPHQGNAEPGALQILAVRC
jgi:preprotein translocase subunit SecA